MSKKITYTTDVAHCGGEDCDKYLSKNFVACCKDVIGYDRIFKKSDKKFEK